MQRCQWKHNDCLCLSQVRQLQSRLSDSNSLTARLQREMLLVKAKAEALEFSVSEKDAEIELLRQKQERQDTQVMRLTQSCWCKTKSCLICDITHCSLGTFKSMISPAKEILMGAAANSCLSHIRYIRRETHGDEGVHVAQAAVSCSLLYEVFQNVDAANLACCAYSMGICFAMCFGTNGSQLYNSKSYIFMPELPITGECMSIGCC